MVRLSIKVTVVAATLFACPLAGEAPHLASPAAAASLHRSFVMFGASWCAPCIVELRNIGAIAAAAGPDRIVIAWADSGIRNYRRTLPANVEIAPDAASQQLTRRFAADASGLPYTVMLNERGRKCAVVNAALTPGSVDELRRACGSAGPDPD